jgi:uncharacterized lipoprotein YajG
MFLRIIFLGIVIVFISGCATPSQLIETTPILVLKSEKPANLVAFCIVKKWESTTTFGAAPSVNLRPAQDGFLVYLEASPGITQLLADVKDVPTGSTTRYFKGAVLFAEAFDKGVQACQ